MSQLFVDIQQALNRTDLKPLTEESLKAYKGLKNTYQEIKDYLYKKGLSIDDVYESTSGHYAFWYIENPVFIPLFNIDIESLKVYQLPERVETHKEMLTKYWENGEYESFFGFVEKQFSFDLFLQLYDQIPFENRYEVFINLYTRNDYGFQQLDQQVVRDLLTPRKGQIEENYFDTDENGYVTIYRGTQDKSASPETAYSWTIDITKAEFFATRFNSLQSAVYKAKVHYSKIIDYITERNESEIIVLPEDLVSIGSMGYLNFDDSFVGTFYSEGYLKDYHQYTNQLQNDWFHKPKGIHGVKHIKRVLMHTLIMSHLDNLSDLDKLLLAYASLYHDIGRTNDNYDLHHGKQSVDKMKKLNLTTKGLSKDERQILEFIMEYHAKPDDLGIRRLKKTGIQDKARAEDLFNRFKDCDGLDRVRLGDLKTKYLRTKTGKQMLLIAHQLLRNLD